MRRPLDAGGDRNPGLVYFFTALARGISFHRNALRDQGSRSLITKLLVITATCLAAVFLTGIVIEAFDLDLDLWPFGAEDFILASPDATVTGGPSVGALAALNGVQGFVISAGAHLVLLHQARSALAIDCPSTSPSFNVAEPRQPYLDAVLVLGHCFHTRLGDSRSIGATARPAPLGHLSRTFRLASRSSS
jgi:hypothetical protein